MNQPTLSAFEMLWTKCGATGDPSPTYQKIVAAYNYSAGRHYHTLEHVYWGLKHVGELIEAEDFNEGEALPIYWAMWFHDMVMHFDTNDSLKDESQSANEAALAAAAAGLSEDFQAQVRRLIMATAHQHAPERPDEAILVDADLSMLGAARHNFDVYEQQVRLEWAHVNEADFCNGREKVLERFAVMPRIFTTNAAHAKWEGMARNNIGRSREQIRRRLDALTPHLNFEEVWKGFFHDGSTHTYDQVLITSDYDRRQRYTTDADLAKALHALRAKDPMRYARLMAALETMS